VGCDQGVVPRRAAGARVAVVLISVLAGSAVACHEDVAADRNPRYDSDGDSIGTRTELDPLNQTLYHFDTTRVDRNPSRALGMPDAGTLDSAIHLFSSWTGYVSFPLTWTLLTLTTGVL